MDTGNKDAPLGREYEDDIGEESLGSDHIGGVPTDPVDKVETTTRSTDYENMSGRVRTGHDGELDLSRVSLEGGGRESGGGDGADWESNMSRGASHTAMDGTGFKFDTRGATSQETDHEDVDPKLQREMRDAGLKLGINSVNTTLAAFAMASVQYVRNKERWRRMPDEYKEYQNAVRRHQRRNRDWEQVRADSVSRQFREIFNGWQKDRVKDDPYYLYGDPAELARDKAIDSSSALQVAQRWRYEVDEKELDAMVVKYAAFLADVQPQAIRGRFRRNKAQKDVAEFVFATDAMACGVVMPGGFDRDALMDTLGDELAIKIETTRSDRERREFIINAAHDYYAKGNLFPPYVYKELEAVLQDVIEILEDAGVDLSEPEEVIDWSKV
jgi:hypothetical protein